MSYEKCEMKKFFCNFKFSAMFTVYYIISITKEYFSILVIKIMTVILFQAKEKKKSSKSPTLCCLQIHSITSVYSFVFLFLMF